MSLIRTVGVGLIIVGFVLALFVTFDPRAQPPIFQGQNIKFVAYRHAIVTTSNVTLTYEQVVLLVSGTARIPDTKVTISGTAYPITSGHIYYFSAYYFYIPTYYTTASVMSIGPVVYSNVYSHEGLKVLRVKNEMTKGGVFLIILGFLMYVIPGIHISFHPRVKPSNVGNKGRKLRKNQYRKGSNKEETGKQEENENVEAKTEEESEEEEDGTVEIGGEEEEEDLVVTYDELFLPPRDKL